MQASTRPPGTHAGKAEGMTPEESRALDALKRVSMRLGSSGKRFRNDLLWCREHEDGYRLTVRQALYLWYLVDMYRRQIPDGELKRWGAHRRLTGELPPIYLEGDHRVLAEKLPKAKREKKFAEHVVMERDDQRTLFWNGLR